MTSKVDEVSERALGFVRRCQLAAGDWDCHDEVRNSRALWDCLSSIPAARSKLDEAAISRALAFLAAGALRSSGGWDPKSATEPWRCRTARGTIGDAVRAVRRSFTSTDLSLRLIADELNTSYWHVSHQWRRQTGYRFDIHLAGWRTLKAVWLLDEGALSLKEIAAVLGYSDSACFSRQFRRLPGINPRRFRQLLGFSQHVRVTGWGAVGARVNPAGGSPAREIDGIPR